MASTTTRNALRQRLLRDIAEIQQDPYPNVHLYINEADIRHACLVLTPPSEEPLHLSITFFDTYPLRAPQVTIQSKVVHPNVFDSYICASILNTEEDWTPAYTLKGILIQLLSFFMSDVVPQQYGNQDFNMTDFRIEARLRRERYGGPTWNQHYCRTCGFDETWVPPATKRASTAASQATLGTTCEVPDKSTDQRSKLFQLPDEVILSLMSFMDTSDVVSFGDAVPTIKHMLQSYDFIRVRELQCFLLKKSFLVTKLGVGVSITGGRRPVFRSEFDLISNEAYLFNIRKSIQGVHFDKWLPVPLSRRHWNTVRQNASHALEGLRVVAKLEDRNKAAVLYHFMNTIVVQFSNDADRSAKQPDARSTLSHASEKAVESYFALFHLLLCVATEDPAIVQDANQTVERFLRGPRSKAHFPDLGHLVIAALISDSGLSETLTFHIIKEAILRNVVWMLDIQGAGMADWAYLEPTAISNYRLAETFEASKTSYRLLMFQKLFSAATRKPGKKLAQLRDELFDTHGAPPPGTSADMAQKIRKIRDDINSFPGFLTAMGIREMPSKQEFSSFLKRTITDSVDAGYSNMPMTQSQLYMIRRVWEPTVAASKEVDITPALERWYENGEKWYQNGWRGRPSFFPARGGNIGRSRGGARGRRGGRGRGRGG